MVTGRDEVGIRRSTYVPTPKPKYVFNCPGCIHADKERMAAPPTLKEEDFARTVFLLPESAYDSKVARAYLYARYGDSPVNLGPSVNLSRVTAVRGAQIIVINRRRFDGKACGPADRRELDDEKKWASIAVPAETYVDEIVESAPVIIGDLVEETPQTMFSAEAPQDLAAIVDHLSQLVAPRYYIACPLHPDDRLYTMRYSG